MNTDRSAQRVPTLLGNSLGGVSRLAEELDVSPADISHMAHNRPDKVAKSKRARIAEALNRSKTRRLLHHLLSGMPITPAEAMTYFGIYRLGARIYDFRKQGYHITTDTSNGYATYRMVFQ